MYTKEDIEKAKQYLNNEGYGTGSNFTLNTVANLMADYAAKNCVIPDMSTKVKSKNKTANGTKPVLRAGLIVIVQDWGRMNQKSFCSSEIWHGINTKKYKECQWIEAYGEERHKEIELKAKAIGWDVEYVQLFG